jgi:hypothetical protein
MTFGILKAEYGHPQVQGFFDRVPDVFISARRTPGFLASMERDLGLPDGAWGTMVVPKCWGGEPTRRHIATLSLWSDIEAVTAFAYHGTHGAAMKLRDEWVVEHTVPEHVAWWIEDVGQLNWEQAAFRLDQLHEEGPSPSAFSLRGPFDPEGQSYRIDPNIVRERAGKPAS